ncbi:PREDICTED: rhodanese-like domain-containing protein 11, chloroplastic [Nicotiana attenuata]|uniref:Rhodanese-like domain-containing protein 11, chloroplastic n=1 Tax=Nicotiana attenuata TaxID=49451 RepID=A0A314L6L1_NICAT|nr:PREDICTED: rhodanese-like domain-containing protein 11, chloroplastic [Nicotiana attenuata]OIT37195.1 rhodanese-like domain-containing protein 11, chloroplastic [Nicotiana attenuata]
MEALAHGLLPLSALRTISQKEHRCRHVGSIHFLSSPVPSSLKFSAPIKYRSGIIRMQEEYELKQMKDMAAAKKRWDSLIRDGKVKVLTPREAGYAIQLSNKTLLDVRPSMERKKAWVKGSTWIPIFDVDTSLELGILSRKATNFLLGGWWSGVPSLSYNKQFLSNVEEKFAKDTDLIVACQKGLRSIAACEVLYNAGYNNIFWVQGGLEAAEEEDLEREGPQPFKFAGIGGLSEFLGWTDQQRDAAAKEGWGYRLAFSARLVGVVLAADALFIGAQKVGQYLQELRTH